jgi:hypothetical protein
MSSQSSIETTQRERSIKTVSEESIAEVDTKS